MSIYYPILIIDDDKDDQETLMEVFKDLEIKNPTLFFNDCNSALDYLAKSTEIVFLILCDVNLPGINGLKLRRMIDKDARLRKKSIPFVFYSTAAIKEEVNEAYEMMVQGYFVKPSNYDQIKDTIRLIIDYWKVCIHPNNWS